MRRLRVCRRPNHLDSAGVRHHVNEKEQRVGGRRGMAQAAEWAKMAILLCKWPMRQFGRSSALAHSHSDGSTQGAQGTVFEL